MRTEEKKTSGRMLRITLGVVVVLMVGVSVLRIVQLRRRQPAELWQHVLTAQRSGQDDVAEVYLRKLIALDPDDGRARAALAYSILRNEMKRDPEADFAGVPDAFEQLREAARLSPDNEALNKVLLQTWQSMGRTSEAETTAERIVAAGGDAVSAITVVIDADLKNKQWQDAAGHIDRLLELTDETAPVYLLRRARLLDGIGDSSGRDVFLDSSATALAQKSRLSLQSIDALNHNELAAFLDEVVRRVEHPERLKRAAHATLKCLEVIGTHESANGQRTSRVVEMARILLLMEGRIAETRECDLDRSSREYAFCRNRLIRAVENGHADPLVWKAATFDSLKTGNSTQALKCIASGIAGRKTTDSKISDDTRALFLVALAGVIRQPANLRELESQAVSLIENPSTAGPGHLLLASIRLKAGAIESAAEHSVLAEQLLDEMVVIDALAARIAIEQKRWGDVLRRIDRVRVSESEANSTDADDHLVAALLGGRDRIELHRAAALHGSGRSSEAMDLLERLHQTSVGSQSVRLAAGIHVAHGGSEKALALLLEAASRWSDDYQIHLGVVSLLLHSDKADEAVRRAKDFVTENPASLAGRLLLGEILMRRDDVDGAVELLLVTCNWFPHSEAARIMAIQACRRDGRISDVSILIEQLRKLGNGKVPALVLKSSLMLEEFGVQAARHVLDQTEEDVRGTGAFYLATGKIASASGRLTEALDAFVRATEDPTTLAAAESELVSTLLRIETEQGTREGVARLEETLKKCPHQPVLLQLSGELAFRQGEIESARLSARRLIQQRPRRAEGYLLLARTLIDSGDICEAESHVHKALQLTPGNPDGLLLRAHVLAATGAYSESFDVLSGLPTEVLRQTDAARLRCRVLLSLDREPEALKWLHSLGAVDFRSGLLFEDLVSLHARAKRFETALELVDSAVAAGATDWPIQQAKILLLCRQSRWQEAGAFASQIVVDKQNVEVIQELQDTFHKAGWPSATLYWAQEALARGAEIDASEVDRIRRRVVEVSLGLWTRHRMKKHLNVCVAELERLVDSTPDDVESLNTLIWLLATETGNAVRAADLCERLEQLRPRTRSTVSYVDTMVTALRKAGRFSEARVLIDSARTAHPDSVLLRFQSGMLQAQLGFANGKSPDEELLKSARKEIESSMTASLPEFHRNDAQRVLKLLPANASKVRSQAI